MTIRGPRTLQGSLAAVAVFAGVLALAGSAVGKPARAAGKAPEPQSEAGKYTGPGSCSSSSCHGSIQPRAETRVAQNEYSTWVVKDRHAKAFSVLTTPVSQRMARILALPKPETAPRCLACHALDVPAGQRGRSFELNEGVSCESCHGPASAWLGPHTTRDWPHEKSVQMGMYNTKDLVKRSEKCLSCHLGTAEKFVDHQMIAAGHPNLYFELDSFTAVMPAHWKEPLEKDPWRGARAWSVGQAVQLREGLRQLSRRARSGVWPEFAELQCYACHHALTSPQQSWRQERGYAGRRPGDAPWNASRYAVLRSLAHEVDAASAQQLDADLTQISQAASKLDSDRGATIATAGRAAEVADSLTKKLNTMPMDRALALRLMKRIASDGEAIAGQGEHAAEQAALALDALFVATARNERPGSAQETRAAILGLLQQVENPAAYNPASFAQQMRKVHAALNSMQ